MTLVVAIAAAGSLGAVARSTVDGVVADRTRGAVPLGTMTVNVLGSLVMGFVTGLYVFHGGSHAVVLVVGTGFCGGFTTWSTFTWETVRLLEGRKPDATALHLAGGLLGSLAAAALGFVLAAL